MANARPPSGTGGDTPKATIGFDYKALQNAPNVARQYGQATAKELQNAFKLIQNEQRLAQTQANTTLAAVRAQQAQITATTRAESQQRIIAARQESNIKSQQARAEASTVIEQERRKTAAFKAELRQRQQAQVSGGGFARGVIGAFAGSMGGPVGALAGAGANFGAGIGGVAAGVGVAAAQGIQAAYQASQVAAAYNRQRVAATNLAGSQARLNELMRVYDQATGGAIDNATALGDVTRLLSIGFADSSDELREFVTAVRGISIATGQTQEYVSQQLQLAIANQSTMRLDQVGLGVSEVKDKVDQLKNSNAGLTEEMAYQQAILELANRKYGALVKSTEAQATGAERAAKASKDLRLELGQDYKPKFDLLLGGLADVINGYREARREAGLFWKEVDEGFNRAVGIGSSGPQFKGPIMPWLTSATPYAGPPRAAPFFNQEQIDTGVDFVRQQEALDAQRDKRLRDESIDYNRQRADAISNNEKRIARESEDFARQRANAERSYNLAILQVHEDSARQRAKWERDLAENLSKIRSDSAERIADMQEASNERVAEIQERFAEDTEKRERKHRESIRDAAARLDAVAVREEQRRFAEESKERAKEHEDALADQKKQLDKQVANEQENLAEREAEEKASHQRRLDEQKEADALRLQEMRDNFDRQREQEDTERGIRLAREAEDFADSLSTMATQHGLRVQQIKDQARTEREELDKAFEDALAERGKKTDRWIKEHERLTEAAEKYLDRIFGRIPGATPRTPENQYQRVPVDGSIPPVTASSNTTNTRSTTVIVQPNGIVIQEARTPEQTKAAMWEALHEFYSGE